MRALPEIALLSSVARNFASGVAAASAFAADGAIAELPLRNLRRVRCVVAATARIDVTGRPSDDLGPVPVADTSAAPAASPLVLAPNTPNADCRRGIRF